MVIYYPPTRKAAYPLSVKIVVLKKCDFLHSHSLKSKDFIMKAKYDVSVRSVKEIKTLPDSWTNDDYQNILELTNFEDRNSVDEGELKEYTLMALQDYDPDEAAEIVLSYKLSDKLNKGKIQNIAHEMMQDKLWEEYQDISLHKKLFDCGVMMHDAFPRKFPEARALKCVIEVTPKNDIARNFLAEPDKTLLVRMLAHGMDDHAIINRLFDDQVAGKPFAEAQSIIWSFDQSTESGKAVFTIYSSHYWIHGMDDVSNYQSEAFSDLISTH